RPQTDRYGDAGTTIPRRKSRDFSQHSSSDRIPGSSKTHGSSISYEQHIHTEEDSSAESTASCSRCASRFIILRSSTKIAYRIGTRNNSTKVATLRPLICA